MRKAGGEEAPLPPPTPRRAVEQSLGIVLQGGTGTGSRSQGPEAAPQAPPELCKTEFWMKPAEVLRSGQLERGADGVKHPSWTSPSWGAGLQLPLHPSASRHSPDRIPQELPRLPSPRRAPSILHTPQHRTPVMPHPSSSAGSVAPGRTGRVRQELPPHLTPRVPRLFAGLCVLGKTWQSPA